MMKKKKKKKKKKKRISYFKEDSSFTFPYKRLGLKRTYVDSIYFDAHGYNGVNPLWTTPHNNDYYYKYVPGIESFIFHTALFF
jgi:hypothetical protein